MRDRGVASVVSGLVALPVSVAVSAQVYTWKDSEGVTHYSQRPPRDATVEPSAIEVPATPSTRAAGDDDYFSVIRQAERMEKSRLENETSKQKSTFLLQTIFLIFEILGILIF